MDNTILAGTNKYAIVSEIKILGFSSDEHRHKFGLIDEGKFGDFLIIIIENTGPSLFHLTQTRLIQKFLTTAYIKYCN